MRNYLVWLGQLAAAIGGGSGRYRVARMLRFVHRHGTPKQVAHVIGRQQVHEREVHAAKLANRRKWAARPGHVHPRSRRLGAA